MAGPLENRMASERNSPELKSKIKAQMIKVAGYGQAIARLSNTIEDEGMLIIKARRRFWQKRLEADEKQYETISRMPHTECLPEDSHVPVISIAELSQVAFAEAKALEDMTTLHLALRQLTANRASLEQELQNKMQEKERTQTGPIKSVEATGNDSEIQELKSNTEEYADMIQKHESIVVPLHRIAWAAMEAANRASKSDLDVRGIGRWSPIPAPTLLTTAPVADTTAPTTITTEPIKVTTAQVNVADIHLPKSRTAIIQVDERLSNITMCLPQRQYANVKSVEKDKFKNGDIGWFPVLRPSLSASSADIHTEFGYIYAKSYPLIIVEKLDDCMLGLIISTSNGNGLSLKSSFVKGRSVPIVTESSSISTSSDWGQYLYPRKKLKVEGSSGYIPPTGAYVDMFNVIMIPYDSRFQIKGKILAEDVLLLEKMRLSATLRHAIPVTAPKIVKFCNWFSNWAFRAHVGEALIPVLQQVANSRRLLELEEARKKV